MREIIREAMEALAAGEPVALSTIVSTSGSLPMSRRSKLLVRSDGTARGTVGGGCLEAEIYAGAQAALRSPGPPGLRRFVLTESQAGAEGLNCGGTVEILTEVLRPGPVEAVLASCMEAIDARVDAVLGTRLEERPEGDAGKILIRREGPPVGSLGSQEADGAAVELASGMLGSDAHLNEPSPGGGRLFLETVQILPTVILFGGGHVSAAVARVAKAAGFRVTVVDDRPTFADRGRHPDADETRVLSMEEAVAAFPVDRNTYLVAVTRGHQHDEIVIRQALRTPAGYVGMIGSRRKVSLMLKKLEAEGFARKDLSRLHAPIGLDIGGDSPGEIAVSIVAELIAVYRRGGHASSLAESARAGC